MNNPYLEEFRQLTARFDYDSGEGSIGSFVEGMERTWYARGKLTSKYSWAIPNEEALSAIARYAPILEIGAGTGYWAHLLRQMGVDVVALDSHPPREDTDHNSYHPFKATWTHVRKPFGPGLSVYHKHALFLCWPPYATSMARRWLLRYPGDTVIYIGEGPSGCNADDSFFFHLERLFEQVEEVTIPQWPGLHDRMTIWRRRARQCSEVAAKRG